MVCLACWQRASFFFFLPSCFPSNSHPMWFCCCATNLTCQPCHHTLPLPPHSSPLLPPVPLVPLLIHCLSSPSLPCLKPCCQCHTDCPPSMPPAISVCHLNNCQPVMHIKLDTLNHCHRSECPEFLLSLHVLTCCSLHCFPPCFVQSHPQMRNTFCLFAIALLPPVSTPNILISCILSPLPHSLNHNCAHPHCHTAWPILFPPSLSLPLPLTAQVHCQMKKSCCPWMW